jgi:hypothetical protein
MREEDVQFTERALDDLRAPTKRLNDWELEFLTNITDRFMRLRNLTEGQLTKLRQLHAEKAL